MSHEVELMVSANEARNALKEIIEDRKALSQEISVLKSKLQEKMDEPSSKVSTACEKLPVLIIYTRKLSTLAERAYSFFKYMCKK